MGASSRRLEVLRRHLKCCEAGSCTCSSTGVHGGGGGGGGGGPALLACRAGLSHARLSLPVVIGGMVMDFQAHPTGPSDIQRGGSVPGSITQSPGERPAPPAPHNRSQRSAAP